LKRTRLRKLCSGAIQPLPRDGGVALHENPTVGSRPKVWTRDQR